MANQTSEEYTEQLFQAIDTIVSNRVKDLPYDQTIICTITDDTQAEYGKYTVTTNAGSQFTVYSENTSYVNGDRVYVRVPQNDFSAQKIITGAYVKGDTAPDLSAQKDNFYGIKGKPLSGNQTLNIDDTNTVQVFDDIDRQEKRYNGYLVARLNFAITNDENFVRQFKKSSNGIAVDYTQSQLDACFTIKVTYRRPDSYNSDELQQKSFLVNLRDIQANIFRQNSYSFRYDLDYRELITNSGIEPDILLQEIEVSDFKFVGEEDKIEAIKTALPAGIVPIKLQVNNPVEFGYYLENNIGYYIHLFSEDNNFYNIDRNNAGGDKQLYFYCYEILENNQAKSIKPNQLSLDALGLKLRAQVGGNDITVFPIQGGQIPYIEYQDELDRYKLTLNKQNNGLKEDSISLICNISLITGDAYQSPVILVDDNLTLNNEGYSSYWGRFRGRSKFLYAVTDSQILSGILGDKHIEDISGVYYLYGQDGKPTDSKVSYVKYGCFVRFVDPDGTALNSSFSDKIKVAVDTGGKDLESVSMLRYPSNNSDGWVVNFDDDNGYAYVEYRISNYYSQHKNKNTFYWSFAPDGDDSDAYTLEVPIYFGYSGSQGSEYNLVLDLVRKDDNNNYILEQAIRLKDDNTLAGDYYIRSTLYNYDNKEAAIAQGNYSASLSETNIPAPTKFINSIDVADIDPDNIHAYFKIQPITGTLQFSEASIRNYAQIAKISIEQLQIEAFLPLAFAKDPYNKYKLSGPSTITYDITGKKPNSQKIPYSLVSDDSGSAVISYTYNLDIHGKVEAQFPKLDNEATAVVKNYLTIPSAYTEAMNSAPPTMYIKDGNKVIWVQPIYICQNKYPAAMNNGEQNITVIQENGKKGEVNSVSVGKMTESGTGLFIGEYRYTNEADSVYGLYGFGKTDSGSPQVNNIFRLTANGIFEADMTLLEKNSANQMVKASSIIDDILYPVGYKDGKPIAIQNIPIQKVYTDTQHTSETQATLLDLAKGVVAIKELLQQIYSATPPSSATILEELGKIKLEVEE